LARVAKAVVAAAGAVPVTAKIRIGWDARSVNAVETAHILEREGIRRLAIHGRTKEQGYTGAADWSVIASVVQCVNIPVIGNGDIDSAEVALARWKESGVAGLMIGRAAMNHPWIFREIKSALSGESAQFVTLKDKWSFIAQHCESEILWWEGREDLAMRAMRARLMAYTRGLPSGARLREKLQQVETLDGVRDIAAAHLAEYGTNGQ
jgi:tRNA-dihydrouridine synthase